MSQSREDVVVMEVEEQLLQEGQQLEHAVRRVGVNLSRHTVRPFPPTPAHPPRVRGRTHSMACGVFPRTQATSCAAFSKAKTAAAFVLSRPCSMSGPTTLTHSE